MALATRDKARISVVLGNPQEKRTVVRYDAADEDAPVKNVYVGKEALRGLDPRKDREEYPDLIVVTVDSAG